MDEVVELLNQLVPQVTQNAVVLAQIEQITRELPESLEAIDMRLNSVDRRLGVVVKLFSAVHGVLTFDPISNIKEFKAFEESLATDATFRQLILAHFSKNKDVEKGNVLKSLVADSVLCTFNCIGLDSANFLESNTFNYVFEKIVGDRSIAKTIAKFEIRKAKDRVSKKTKKRKSSETTYESPLKKFRSAPVSQCTEEEEFQDVEYIEESSDEVQQEQGNRTRKLKVTFKGNQYAGYDDACAEATQYWGKKLQALKSKNVPDSSPKPSTSKK